MKSKVQERSIKANDKKYADRERKFEPTDDETVHMDEDFKPDFSTFDSFNEKDNIEMIRKLTSKYFDSDLSKRILSVLIDLTLG